MEGGGETSCGVVFACKREGVFGDLAIYGDGPIT